MGKEHIAVKPVQRDLLYTKIADAIIQYIKENGLKNGDKIPSERVLAQEFNTSRNSVREALRVLERDHIIEVKMGKGAYITSENTQESFYLKLWKVNYIEMLEIKSILELHIIENLCGNLTAAQAESLEMPLRRMEKGAEMGLFLQNEDFVFHSRIRKIYNNSTLEQMLDNLVKALDDYGRDLEGVSYIWRQTIPYHRQILDAMVKNRPFAAREAYIHIEELDRKALEIKEKLESSMAEIQAENEKNQE